MFKPVRMVWGFHNGWTYEWFYTSALGRVLIFTDSCRFENLVAKLNLGTHIHAIKQRMHFLFWSGTTGLSFLGILGIILVQWIIRTVWSEPKTWSAKKNIHTHLQCTIIGPASGGLQALTLRRKARNGVGCSGTPWSGQAVNWKWRTSRFSLEPLWTSRQIVEEKTNVLLYFFLLSTNLLKANKILLCPSALVWSIQLQAKSLLLTFKTGSKCSFVRKRGLVICSNWALKFLANINKWQQCGAELCTATSQQDASEASFYMKYVPCMPAKVPITVQRHRGRGNWWL